MVHRTLSRRLYSWVRRWWLKHRMPRRSPIVHCFVPTLKPLEERSSPTAFGITAPLALASSQLAPFDSGMDSSSRDSWRTYGNGAVGAGPQAEAAEEEAGPIGINCWATT
ncbi:MAG TPA: hypothetical protein VH575_34860 [Gemmataceae bacterium]|jgi:hypothetical protein